MTMKTITLTETDRPSRSKQAGPCWVAIGSTYASSSGKSIEAEEGEILEVTAKVTVRRATKNTTDRKSWRVQVTGNPDNVVHVKLGSPQPVSAEISGVVLLPDGQ